MNQKLRLGSLLVTIASQWRDVTQEIGGDNPPITLAKPEGVGVLQFSQASYIAGENPNVSLQDLTMLLADFANSRELTSGFASVAKEGSVMICGMSFVNGNQFIRVWYCSNGRDITLVTYVCENGCEGGELGECEAIVGSLQFVT